MTVPGKGGRPRKWRSDADRARAYRARQVGGEEPPVLARALDDGDELFRVWALVRDLGAQLDAAKGLMAQASRERDRAHSELAAERRRWGWIEAQIAELAAERDRFEVERDTLAQQLVAIRHRVALLEQQLARQVAPADAAARVPGGLSRAQRRQLEREQARRPGRSGGVHG